MKQGKSLNEVLTDVCRQNEQKRDYVSHASKLSLSENGRNFRMNDSVFGTTDLFHSQIGTALGIPAKYYRVMQE